MRTRRKRIFHGYRLRSDGQKRLLCWTASGYITANDDEITCKQCLRALGHPTEPEEKYSRKNFLLGQVLS